MSDTKTREEIVVEDRARQAALLNTDDASPVFVLSALLGCALAWEGDARLLGNVRSSDIQRALKAVLLNQLRPAEPAQARAEVLEEAAKIAERTTNYDDALQLSGGGMPCGQRIAASIRALALQQKDAAS